MPTELLDAIRTIEAGLDRVPVLLIAIVLLTCPTLLWLGYRYFVVMARPPVIGADIDEEGGLFWICERCRSAGELHETHCYHCGLERVEITVPSVSSMERTSCCSSPMTTGATATGPVMPRST